MLGPSFAEFRPGVGSVVVEFDLAQRRIVREPMTLSRQRRLSSMDAVLARAVDLLAGRAIDSLSFDRTDQPFAGLPATRGTSWRDLA